jgi:phosphoserine phosphatase RsbU/P
VLANLLGNALSYSPAATPVRVTWRGEEGALAVEVANQGPPIPPELMPHLFEPFRRGPGTQAGKKGLGLGLFIARQIVLAHGGSIEARSSASEGTVFTVRLPRHPAAPT